MNLKRAVSGFLLSFFFLLIFFYLISGVQWLFDNYRVGSDNFFSASTLGSVENDKNSVPPLEINALSAISVESNLAGLNKVVFDKNSGLKLPIASLTKLMTAIVVLDNYNLSENVVISKKADLQDPMKVDVKLGDKLAADSLLKMMLIGSSNKAAYALAEKMGEDKFVRLMNERSKEIGMANTSFTDPTGLSSENVSTAGDLSKLAEYILSNYPKIAEITRTQELDVPDFGKIKNTDELLGEIPDVVCGKTGFTIQAKGCLLLVKNNTKKDGFIINVILGADDRFLEMKKIIDWQNSTTNK